LEVGEVAVNLFAPFPLILAFSHPPSLRYGATSVKHKSKLVFTTVLTPALSSKEREQRSLRFLK
jgi:hypothetical protein